MDYADDTAIFTERDNHGKMCERMGNCAIATETIEIKIQWVKVLILMHAWGEPKEELPPPFGLNKFRPGGTIIGGEIYMAENLANAVAARIKKERKPHMGTGKPKDLQKQGL